MILLFAMAAAAQGAQAYAPTMTREEELKMSALTDLAGRVVGASKASDDVALRRLTAPGATFAAPKRPTGPLSAASFHHEASVCSPAYGVDPEISNGRLTITEEVVRVIWNCPSGDRSQGTETILRFKDGRILSARTKPGGFIRTVTPPHG